MNTFTGEASIITGNCMFMEKEKWDSSFQHPVAEDIEMLRIEGTLYIYE